MGLLSLGEPLSYEDNRKYAQHVQRHGIKQFINIFNINKNRIDRCFKWGDEIEYVMVRFDHQNSRVRLSLRPKDILDIMYEREEREGPNRRVLWRPEYGSFMIEATPGQPYGHQLEDNGYHKNSMSALFNEVEINMGERRRDIQYLLKSDETLLCLSNFPRLGTEDITVPFSRADPLNSSTGSIFVGDELTNRAHPRYFKTGYNIVQRRGRKIAINIPIFKDTKTADPFVELFNDKESNRAAKVDHIYLDAPVLGMGCSCLQVTMQATNISEAMLLNDQMLSLTPIMMALSAATPIFRGYLSDRDCRWDVVSSSMDDRTPEEMGEKPFKHEKYRLHKSRCSPVNTYLCESNAKYNDNPIVYNEEYYEEMVSAGVPPMLAQHIAYLFVRDPTVTYQEKLDQNDDTDWDHFENIQSTNWQSLRFKAPPLNQPSIGWRVEFRPMEIQMTDFENAAYAVFTVLLSRVILQYNLNLVIPVSKIDKNMTTAQNRDAVNRCKFWFRKDIFSQNSTQEVNSNSNGFTDCEDESYIQMTINEIMNGLGQEFPGLVPLVRDYVNSISLDAYTSCKVQQYIQLIADRASGKLWTTAQWIRHYVRKHMDYKYDSVVNHKITYDLLMTCNRIQSDDLIIKQLVGDYKQTIC